MAKKIIQVRNGQTVRALGPLPPPLGSITFRTGLVTSVLAHLAQKVFQPLDGDHTRMKVLFADGWLRDAKAREWRRATCADRMHRGAACTSVCFEADLTFLEVELKEFYENGGTSLYDELEGEQRRRATTVKEKLAALEPTCELLRLLRAFSDDYDETLFIIRHMLRAALAHPRFTQFMYIYGTGSSGAYGGLKTSEAFLRF